MWSKAFSGAAWGALSPWRSGADRAAICWSWKVGSRNAAEPEGTNPAVACRRNVKMARAEAVLLVSDAPLSPRRLAQLATLADATEARTQIQRLNAAYEQAGSPFRVERVAAGYRMFTLPQYAFWLGKLHHREAELKLSTSSMETLTIIAYRQPITRADVEAIRGVQSSEMIKQLMERNLVRIGGEDNSLGRPFLYETTRRFLEVYGLRDLDELPLADKLRRRGGAGEEPPPDANPAGPEPLAGAPAPQVPVIEKAG
jgi:segregation and condensation protein B